MAANKGDDNLNSIHLVQAAIMIVLGQSSICQQELFSVAGQSDLALNVKGCCVVKVPEEMGHPCTCRMPSS